MFTKLKKLAASLIAAAAFLSAASTAAYAQSAPNYNVELNTYRIAATDSSIKISWEKSGAQAYRISLKDSSTKKFAEYAVVKEPECTITGLNAGEKYRIRVTPLALENGEYTDKPHDDFGARTKKLPAPEGITATAGKNSVTLSWNAQEGAVKYGVYMSDGAGKYGFLGYTKKSSYTVKKLEENRMYSFRIFAVTSGTKFQTLSEPVKAMTKGELPAPETLLKENKISRALCDKLKSMDDGEKVSVMITVVSAFSESDTELLVFSETGLTRSDFGYNYARLNAVSEYFSALTGGFIEKYASSEVKAGYVSKFTPVITVTAGRDDILLLASRGEAAYTDIFEDSRQQND